MIRAPKAPATMQFREAAIAYAAAGMQPGDGRAEGLMLLYLLVKCRKCEALQHDPWRECEHRDPDADWAAIEGRRKG